jgi:thymidylate kinase
MKSKYSPRIVSFSGIDGAGKTTQVIEFEAWLRDSGLHTTLLTFWDDVVVLPQFREFLSLRAFKGDPGVGSPEKPLQRRDKNVTAWPVTAMRFFLYAADAVNLHLAVRRLRNCKADVVIFDRYIYDELANLPLKSGLTRVFLWLIRKIAPQPDVAYVIDADPVAAFARKPEYPLEFLRSNRQAYLTLARLVGGATIIEPASIEMMGMRIKKVIFQELFGANTEFCELPVLQ